MLTNFPFGISSMGNPVLGGGMPMVGPQSRVIFVDASYGNDGNDGRSWETAVKTVAQAYSLVTTNRDDVIVLSTYAQHELTAMLDVSKSRVHFIGDMNGRTYGQRARINYADGVATADAFAIKNTGVGNTFTGIKFLNNNTDAQVVATVGEGGEYSVYRNCEFYNSTNLDSNTVSELVLNGDSAQFYNCTFGSLADSVSGDKVRPAVLMTAGTVGSGLVSRDVLFDGCKFWKNAGGTTTSFIKLVDNDLERLMEIKNCTFMNNMLGAVPAVAINSATLTKSLIVLSGDTVACECTKIGTATGILNATPARVATATIAIQAT
jgi:hypothetical protein